MPSRTNVAKETKSVHGFKIAKDRITILLCSNASGDSILKPLLVNKNLKPQALKGKLEILIDFLQKIKSFRFEEWIEKKLPLHWMANKKSWMTASIFREWFQKSFGPEVREYMILK